MIREINGRRFFIEPYTNLYLEDLSGADLIRVELRSSDLSYANLCNANLMGTDLRRARLYGASLSGAILKGANLYEADLRDIDIDRADLSFCKGIITFMCEKHLGIYFKYKDDYWITIGCQSHKLDYWLEYFEIIGLRNGYTREHINFYGDMIKLLSQYELTDR